MVEADWGVDDDSWHLGPGSVWEPVLSDRPEDLPAVATARQHGYLPAPEAPLWCFLPAIWPREGRTWVRDNRARSMIRQCGDEPAERLPWSAADHADIESDTNAMLAELGLPPRPAGRVWLLRAPAPYAAADDLLRDIWRGWTATGGPAMATPELVEYAAARLREVF